MQDPREQFVEALRREQQVAVNSGAIAPAASEQTWDTAQLAEDFEVTGFCAPYVVVKRKRDGKIGSLMFRHSPRIYFGFQEDK